MQISPHLPTPPHISPCLPRSPHISLYLPISPHISWQVLDVMQIFGRAGRPQFDVHGEGIIITEHKRLAHYLQLLTHQLPIESQFVKMLSDHLNAEISLGTVTSVREAVTWLSYTYLFVRMCRNPMAYGIPYEQKESDA